MAHNKVETLVANCAIKSPVDKYYGFFKYNLSEIVKIFLLSFKAVQLVEGQEGKVGCVKLWSYVLGGIPLKLKVKTESIDDEAKSIKFTALEGDYRLLYKSLKATIVISDSLAKWTLEFEKATLRSPLPELYIPILIAICTLTNAYIPIIN